MATGFRALRKNVGFHDCSEILSFAVLLSVSVLKAGNGGGPYNSSKKCWVKALQRDAINYTVAVSACEKGRQHQQALELF